MKKKLGVLCLCACLLLVGCSSGKDTVEETPGTENTEETTEEEPEEVDPYAGMAKNPLTGLYIPEEEAANRPLAVMINNLHKALPQSGIAEADIIYECLAEGEITRLVAIFQTMTGEKIGPVRSARNYYTYFALDNDAVYIHHGGSDGGYAAIRNRDVDSLDGMNDTTAFWRDQQRMNMAGMYEHSSYISAEGVYESCADHGYTMTEEAGYQGMFQFYDEETEPMSGTAASTVKVHYSDYQVGEFYYDATTGQYERWQSGSPQIDDQTGETLTFKNILIQSVNMRVIDDAGRRDVDLVGSGTGYYITEGKCIAITWEKPNYYTPTTWYGDDGNELVLNPGKTWVCVHAVGGEITME